MRFLADENFPMPAFRLLLESSVDIIHIALDAPSTSDVDVISKARETDRILLTFDRDIGELLFAGGEKPPPGVVFFRLKSYSRNFPAELLMKMIEEGKGFRGCFTIVTNSSTRQRGLWLQN